MPTFITGRLNKWETPFREEVGKDLFMQMVIEDKNTPPHNAVHASSINNLKSEIQCLE